MKPGQEGRPDGCSGGSRPEGRKNQAPQAEAAGDEEGPRARAPANPRVPGGAAGGGGHHDEEKAAHQDAPLDHGQAWAAQWEWGMSQSLWTV